MTADPIAVVGMGLAVPGASSPGEFWALLGRGAELFTEPPPDRWSADDFCDPDPRAPDKSYQRRSGYLTGFTPHPRLAAELDVDDPALDLTMLWLRHSLHQSLEGVARRSGDRFSLSVGYTADGSQHLEEAMVLGAVRNALRAGAADGIDAADLEPGERAVGQLLARGGPGVQAFAPHRVVADAVRGVLPADCLLHVLDTACSSSLYAVDLGARDLATRRADIAVCGGSFALTPSTPVLFSKLKGLSPSGVVRSLDQRADGVLFSDGAGLVVLKRLSRALADGDTVHGTIAGIGLSADGKGKAIYAPSRTGQALAVRRALAKAGAEPSEVGCIIAHATGTPAGDAAEFAGLRECYAAAARPIPVTSNKSLVGHTGWTAGVVSVIHLLLALRHERIPAQYRYTAAPAAFGAESGSLTIPREPGPWPAEPGGKPRTGAVSAFGFGGTNAHVLLREYRPGASGIPSAGTVQDDEVVVVGWSGHLPGTHGLDDVQSWARGERTLPLSFGDGYPRPPFERFRMPPGTVRALDRAQLMLVESTQRLEPRVLDAFRRSGEQAGVVVGHMGPTRHAQLYHLRTHLDAVQRVLGSAGGDGPLTKAAYRFRDLVQGLIDAPTEDSFPGEMPNLIASRLSNYFDLRGLNMTVDAGEASLVEALDVAFGYLAAGDLDAALVGGVNGNTLPEWIVPLRALLGWPDDREAAEGSFLFALARRAVAEREGLPVLAVLDRGAMGATARPAAPGPSFLGGEGGAELVRFLTGHEQALDLRLQPDLQSAGRAVRLRRPAQEFTGAADDCDVRLERAQQRYVVSLAPRSLPPVAASAATLDASLDVWSLVLTADPGLLPEFGLASEVAVLSVGSSGPAKAWQHGRATPLADLERELPSVLDARPLRICAVLDLGERRLPDHPEDALLRMHDAVFLTAREWAGWAGDGSSFSILLLRGISADGVPHPGSGLFTGFAKALAAEVPKAKVVAVAHDARRAAEALPDLLAETASADGMPAVYYAGGRRLVQYAETRNATRGTARLTSRSVVVAAGGGRGIGAEMLKALAEQTGPRIYVLGSNSLHSHDPSALQEDDDAFADRRRRFLRERSTGPGRVTVAQAAAEFSRLAQAREVHTNLAGLRRRVGPDRVTYIACDLRDPDAVTAAVQAVHTAHDRVDLLLNVAGINRAAEVRQKPLQDFRAVRDLKLLAYANLKRAFAASPPAQWCNCGSAAGFLGLRGETDYSAANDFLTTAAMDATANGLREYTIGWGLWGETGLGNDPFLRAQLVRNAELTPMTNAEATGHFLAELAQDPHVPATVLLGENERDMLRRSRQAYIELIGSTARCAAAPARSEPTSGYLDEVVERTADTLTATRTFDLRRDGYLEHHLVNGHPTLPGMLIVEMAAQAAAQVVPRRVPVAFEDVRFERFLRVHRARRAEPKRIQAQLLSEDRNESVVEVRVLTDITAPDGRVLRRDQLHASARVLLRDEPLPAPRWESWPSSATDRALNPYHHARHGITLSGPFASTRDERLHPWGRMAHLALDRAAIERWFPDMLVPVVSLDALAQVSALGSPDAPRIPLAAPRTLRRIDLYGAHTDASLARGGDAVRLYSVQDTRSNRAVAAFSDGPILFQIKDLSAVTVGHVDPRDGRFTASSAAAEAPPRRTG